MVQFWMISGYFHFRKHPNLSSFSVALAALLQERRPRICSPHRSHRASWTGGICRHVVGRARGRLPTLQGYHACLGSFGAADPQMDGRGKSETEETSPNLLAATGPAEA